MVKLVKQPMKSQCSENVQWFVSIHCGVFDVCSLNKVRNCKFKKTIVRGQNCRNNDGDQSDFGVPHFQTQTKAFK